MRILKSENFIAEKLRSNFETPEEWICRNIKIKNADNPVCAVLPRSNAVRLKCADGELSVSLKAMSEFREKFGYSVVFEDCAELEINSGSMTRGARLSDFPEWHGFFTPGYAVNTVRFNKIDIDTELYRFVADTSVENIIFSKCKLHDSDFLDRTEITEVSATGSAITLTSDDKWCEDILKKHGW